MHENRETSEMPAARKCCRRAGEAHGRTARVYVTEESDSGILPMNHSNKDGKPLAESEEGRPLIADTGQYLSAVRFRSLGGCLAQEGHARRRDRRAICR